MSSIMKRCRNCGGFGVGVVKDHGYCQHCFTTRGSGGGSAKAPVGIEGSGIGVGGVSKRPREEQEEEEEAAVEGGGRKGYKGASATTAATTTTTTTTSSTTTHRHRTMHNNNNNNEESNNDTVSPEEIQRLLAEADKADIPALDANGVKRMFLKVEKAITKNQLARAKYSDEPWKFIESEIELDTELKALKSLSAAPELYSLFLTSTTFQSILNLLSHENTDIAIDVVNLFADLVSSDAVGADVDPIQVPNTNSSSSSSSSGSTTILLEPQEIGKSLVDALIAAGAIDLLLSTLERLNTPTQTTATTTISISSSSSTSTSQQKKQQEQAESVIIQEEDMAGIISTLELFGSMIELLPSTMPQLLCSSSARKNGTGANQRSSSSSTLTYSRLIAFLFAKLRGTREFSEVKGLAAELLSILVASDGEIAALLGKQTYPLVTTTTPTTTTAGSKGGGLGAKLPQQQQQQHYIDGIEYLLEIVNMYKKRVPTSEEEKECVENIFTTLATCLLIKDNQSKFLAVDGFDLMVRLIHEAGYARFGAIRTLSYAIANASPEACVTFITCGGLKSLFPSFMGRGFAHTLSLHGKDAVKQEEEASIAILATCMQLLPKAEGVGVGVGGGGGKVILLPSPSPHTAGLERLRLLMKFKEEPQQSSASSVSATTTTTTTTLSTSGGGGREKIDRLVELHMKYRLKVEGSLDEDSEAEDEEEEEDEDEDAENKGYLRRLRKGLYTLQRIDIVIASLLTSGDADLAFAMRSKLYEQGASITQLIEVLGEYALKLGPGGGGGDGGGGTAVLLAADAGVAAKERENIEQMLNQLAAEAGLADGEDEKAE